MDAGVRQGSLGAEACTRWSVVSRDAPGNAWHERYATVFAPVFPMVAPVFN
jgi:hypothetical protein